MEKMKIKYFKKSVVSYRLGMISLLFCFYPNAGFAETKKVFVESAVKWETNIDSTLYCTVMPSFIYQVTSQALAELIQVLPKGTAVKKGDLVAAQDDAYLEQEIEILKRDLEIAKLNLNYSEQEYLRLQRLKTGDMVSMSELNELKRSRDVSDLGIKRLEHEITVLTMRHKRLNHYAPFDAEVISVDANQGEHVAIGQHIARLLPINKKELECKLPISEYQAIDKSNVSFEYNGKILDLRNISEDLDSATQNVTLYFNGMTVKNSSVLFGERLQITMKKPSSLLTKVPHDAIQLVDKNPKVWKVDRVDKTASQIGVKIVSTLGSYFVIESNALNAGDDVIVRGQIGLKDKEEVQPVQRESL